MASGRPARRAPDPHGWREEGRDLLRGVAAGSIIGIPLLYTMEMWWHGMSMSAWHLLALLAATLAVNFTFCLFSGFRPHYSVGEAASESVTAVGLGMLFSLAVLCLIGEVTFDSAASEILGRVLVETAPVSLGISFANQQVRNKSRDGGEGKERGGQDDTAVPPGERSGHQLRQDLVDLAATVGGATVFAYNMAPTEEIILIASRLSAWQHLGLLAASLVLCYLILFAAGFQDRPVYVPGLFQNPLMETTMAYAVALMVAFGLLWLVGVPEAMSGPATAVKATVTLGLPAVVGASAGRLIT